MRHREGGKLPEFTQVGKKTLLQIHISRVPTLPMQPFPFSSRHLRPCAQLLSFPTSLQLPTTSVCVPSDKLGPFADRFF